MCCRPNTQSSNSNDIDRSRKSTAVPAELKYVQVVKEKFARKMQLIAASDITISKLGRIK